MAHKHSVYDTDNHFLIDGVTRTVKNASKTKTMVVQGDHNSERFTFEIPRYLDHDMSLCNSVEVHFINIDSKTANTATPLTSSGLYFVDDLQVSPESDDVVILSWLISSNATKYAGSLNFLVKFKCVDDEGKVVYVWNTAVYTGIFVSAGIDNGEAVVEECADILAQFESRIQELENSKSETPEIIIVQKTINKPNGSTRGVVVIQGPKILDEDGNVVSANGGVVWDGITPHIGENGNWYIGNKDTNVQASGEQCGLSAIPTNSIVYIDADGNATPLKIGNGLKIVNGVLVATTTNNETTSMLGEAVLGNMILGV